MAHALPREAKVFVESTFAETQSDWDANATEILVIEPDVTGQDKAFLPNENIQARRLNPHGFIQGLKSDSSLSLSLYMTAAGVNAADQGTAVATIQSDIYRAALGGRTLGHRADVAGGTASTPTFTTDPGFEVGDWLFVYDTSESRGEWARVETVGVTPDVTLLWDLSFTPDATDIAYAAIAIFPDEAAMNDHADANHTTLGWLIQGEDTEDVQIFQGCKPTMEIDGITSGEPVKVTVEHMVTDWVDAPTQVTFTSAAAGIAPTVPATGTATSLRMADFGSTLLAAGVDCRGTITPNLGYGWEKVMGVCGREGVKGHIGTGQGEGGPTIMVEYDSQYQAEAIAGTKKHILLEVGDQPLSAWAVYWPRAEYAEIPDRVDEGGSTASQLVFRALEDTASTSGLTGDDIDQRRAPVIILICA